MRFTAILVTYQIQWSFYFFFSSSCTLYISGRRGEDWEGKVSKTEGERGVSLMLVGWGCVGGAWEGGGCGVGGWGGRDHQAKQIKGPESQLAETFSWGM